MSPTLHTAADACAICLIAGAVANILPPIAAALAIVYHLVLLWPTAGALWKRLRGR